MPRKYQFFARLLVVSSLTFSFVPQAAGVEGEQATKPFRPRIDLPYLTDPATLALSLNWGWRALSAGEKLGVAIRRFELRDSADLVLPFRFHPSGRIAGTLGLAGNWILHGGETVSGVFETDGGGSSEITMSRPYLGSVGLACDYVATMRDQSTTYLTRTWSAGIEVIQQLPGTDIDILRIGTLLGVRTVGTIPVTVAASAKRVYYREPSDSSSFRYELRVDWGVPLLYGAYFYPHWEISQVERGRAVTYFRGEFARFARSDAGVATTLFARYVHGRQAPDYRMVSEWQAGVAARL